MSDWRTRAEPVEADWKSRAEPVTEDSDPGFFARLGKHYTEEVGTGLKEMKEGAADVVSPDASLWDRTKGAGQAVLGAARYTMAPIEAPWKAVVVDPAKTATRLMGGSPAAQEFAGNTADAAQMLAGPGVAKAVGEVPGAIRSAAGALRGGSGLEISTDFAKKADDLLYNHLIDSGWTPDKITERLKWLGPGATLADLEPFFNVSGSAAQFPKTVKNAKRVLESRDRGTVNRLLKTVDETLSPANFHETLDYLRANRSAEARPLRLEAMEEAAGKPIKSDMIQRLQKDSPYFNNAMAEGRKIAKEEAAREGIEIPLSESWYHGESLNDPNLQLLHTPTLRMADAAKQGYQALLKPYRNPYTGVIDKADPVAVELSKTVDELTKVLRAHSEKYGQYLDKWSEHSQQMDALARGRQVLANDPEITAKVVRNATPNELEDMQTGLARALKDKIAENPQAAVRYFQKGPVLEKMRLVFADPQAFRAMHRQVLREATKRRTFNQNLRGSQSQERKLGAEGLTAEPDSTLPGEAVGAVADLAIGNKIGLYGRAKRLLGDWANKKPDLTPDIAESVSDVVHSTDPIAQARAVQRFRKKSGVTGISGLTSDLEPYAAGGPVARIKSARAQRSAAKCSNG